MPMRALSDLRLRKWITNNSDELKRIPESERASPTYEHILEEPASNRLLGMQLVLKKDSFVFAVELPQKPLTRRGMLSAISSLFNPLGFVSPVILKRRMTLRAML